MMVDRRDRKPPKRAPPLPNARSTWYRLQAAEAALENIAFSTKDKNVQQIVYTYFKDIK